MCSRRNKCAGGMATAIKVQSPRAKNASKVAGREMAKIDVLESAGLLGEVYATARELVRQAEEGGLVDGPAVVAKR